MQCDEVQPRSNGAGYLQFCTQDSGRPDSYPTSEALWSVRHADFYLRSHLVCSDIMGTRTTSDNLVACHTDLCFGIRQVYPSAERPLKEAREINLEYTTIVGLRVFTTY